MRFAILTHDWPSLHWDFLLEQPTPTGKPNESLPLWTWRLLQEPDSATEITCERLPDHRRRYLDYEGPVSGDRGTVTRWDSGNYKVLSETPNLVIEISGRRMNGKIMIQDGKFVLHHPNHFAQDSE